MLFLNTQDFLIQAKSAPRFTREEEKQLAREAKEDPAARSRLIRSYYPFVAAWVRRAPKKLQTLRLVYTYLAGLEKSVDQFNFQQDSEPFTHHLSWRMRQCLTRVLADRSRTVPPKR